MTTEQRGRTTAGGYLSNWVRGVAAFLAALAIAGLWFLGNDDNAVKPVRSAPPDVSAAIIQSQTVESAKPESGPAEIAVVADDPNPEDNVTDCPDYSGPNDARLNSDEIASTIKSAASALLASNDQEHQLAAALLLTNDESELAFEHLQSAGRQGAAPEVAMWRLLILCDQRKAAACDSSAIDELAINADADNGMMWIQIAGRRLQAGQEESAFDAIRQAISHISGDAAALTTTVSGLSCVSS